MKLITIMETADLNKLQYGIVAENWKYISFGRGKRLFEKEFTPDERVKVAELYKVYSRWYSGRNGSGQPTQHAMSITDYNFAIRVSNFFVWVI